MANCTTYLYDDSRLGCALPSGHDGPHATGSGRGWHDSDDMDGGVAAALIEKEIEDRPSNLIAAYWLRECDRRDEDAKRWKEVARRAIQARAGLRHELVLADERAEKHLRGEGDHRTKTTLWATR